MHTHTQEFRASELTRRSFASAKLPTRPKVARSALRLASSASACHDEPVRAYEWIVCGFFAYLILLARIQPLAATRRSRVLVVGLVCIGLVLVLSQLRLQLPMRVARDWVPCIYLLQGYWMCGLFFRRPMPAVEGRLLRLDRRLFEAFRLDAALERTPGPVLQLLELAYLCAYPFVPATLALLYGAGLRGQADQYWTAVLIAAFACYGLLPWIQTRPPRAIEPAGAMDRRDLALRRVNRAVLARASVQVNTFPSGHAATAVAAALATAELLPGLLVPLLATAGAIAVSTVAGRYHYAADTVLGVAVGAGAWWITT